MDLVGKTAVGKSAGLSRFVSSVVDPMALSERSDSARSRPEKASGARLVLAGSGRYGVQADGKLVDEAAAWITAKIAVTLRRGAHEVGDYVLDKFFSGNPELAKSKSSYKNASFRALAERCGTPELPVSKTWLNNAVGVAVVVRSLPESARAFKELPPSYQESLLPLRDPAKVEKVAVQVATKELSFRQIREVVAEERARAPKAGTRGRPPTPAIVKALSRSMKPFSVGENRRGFSKAEIEELDEKQRKDALASAQTLIERLKDLVDKLKRG